MEKSIIKLLNSYGIDAWFCGGTARDLFLGNTPYGWDIAVRADLATLRSKLTSKIVSTNEYSTSMIIKYMDREYTLFPLKKIELVNTYYNYSFTDSLEEDSNTRDFTINALYYNPVTNEWFDFHNGMTDIDNRTIKFIGVPETRIIESKVRLLRAPILSAILGEWWSIDAVACNAIIKHRLKVATINPRQVMVELEKLFLRAAVPSKAFKMFRHLELLEDFFPELQRCIDVEQSNKAIGLDLFQHIMYAIDSINTAKSNVLTIRLAALLHDIGKPYTEVVIDSKIHFYNHENVGAYLAEKILYRWGFSKLLIGKIIFLIQNHLFDASPYKSEVSIKKLIQKIGVSNIHDLLDLRIADRFGTGRPDIKMDGINRLRDRINIILADQGVFYLAMNDAEVVDFCGGNEALTEILAYLRVKILAGKLQNKPANLKRAIQKINKIQCPLAKAHLFKTWTDIQNDAADTFPDGKLKCGVFCNFICNRKLETDYKL